MSIYTETNTVNDSVDQSGNTTQNNTLYMVPQAGI